MLHHSKLGRLARNMHSNLFAPLVSYEESEVSSYASWLAVVYYTKNQLVLNYTKMDRLSRYMHSSSLVPLVSYEERKVLCIRLLVSNGL